MDAIKAEIREIIARMQGPNPDIIWEHEPLLFDQILKENPEAIQYLFAEFEAMADVDKVKDGLAFYILDHAAYLPAFHFLTSPQGGKLPYELYALRGVMELRRMRKIPPTEDTCRGLRAFLRDRRASGPSIYQRCDEDHLIAIISGDRDVVAFLFNEFDKLPEREPQKAFLAYIVLFYEPYLDAYLYLTQILQLPPPDEREYLGVLGLRQRGEIP